MSFWAALGASVREDFFQIKFASMNLVVKLLDRAPGAGIQNGSNWAMERVG
jgi:hypothetical protein